MDEVLGKFERTAIAPDLKDDSRLYFESLYKNWGKYNDQEDRRKQLLITQRRNRRLNLDESRGILDLVKSIEAEPHQDNVWQSEAKYKPSKYVSGFHKSTPSYSNVLMFSEWMVEKPNDFVENWFLVPCPKGVRMLVVATQGKTKCYTKYGYFRFETWTALPGGNPCEPKFKNQYCVLDCFYHEKDKIMFVLDILAWNSHILTDGETEFRNYWLGTELAHIPDLKSINLKNKIKFKLLPKVSCRPETFNKCMSACPFFPENQPPLDGLLFYHKKAHYIAGETPLVGWLYPFMVPEVLGEEYVVNMLYLINKPEDYTNQATYIEKFEERQQLRRLANRERRHRDSEMDTFDASQLQICNSTGPELGLQMESSVKTSEKMDAESIDANKTRKITASINSTTIIPPVLGELFDTNNAKNRGDFSHVM